MVRYVRSSGFGPVERALVFNLMKRQVYSKMLPIVNCWTENVEGGRRDSGRGTLTEILL